MNNTKFVSDNSTSLVTQKSPTQIALFEAVAKQIAKLPTPTLLRIGKVMGLTSYYLSRYRRHIADVNLRICFPGLSQQQRRQLVKKHFVSSGMGAMEALMAWWKPSQSLPPLEIIGMDHLNDALAKGKGVIFLSAHFTSLELVGRLLSEKLEYAVIYRQQKNQVINTLMQRARERIYTRAINRNDARGIFRALKDNLSVWLAADQDYGRKQSTFALFFGLPAAFITSPTRLANKTGAVVLPLSYYRRDDGQGYQVTIHPECKDFQNQDVDTNASTTSQFIETVIKKHPEQYLWIHRRFKTRPEGKARYYQ